MFFFKTSSKVKKVFLYLTLAANKRIETLDSPEKRKVEEIALHLRRLFPNKILFNKYQVLLAKRHSLLSLRYSLLLN